MKTFRSPLFWFVAGLVGIAAVWFAFAYYKRAFPILDQPVTMDRAMAISKAVDLASRNGWSPGKGFRSAARLSIDNDLTNFIELEAGGKENLSRLVHEGSIAPSRWEVRLFKEKDAAETTVEFSVDGDFLGFSEKLPDSSKGPVLSAEAARSFAEIQARAMGLSLAGFTLVEKKDNRTTSDRLDHTFTYERVTSGLGAGRDQRVLIVRGDRFSGFHQGVKIPDDFFRRFAAMRATNTNLQVISTVAVLLFLVIGAMGGGFVYLVRTGQTAWRGPLILGAVIAVFSGLNSISLAPLSWFGYDTALSLSQYQATTVLRALIQALAMMALVPIFAAGEGLGRAAFQDHPRLWRVFSPRAAGSRSVFGAVLGAYLLCILMFGYEVLVHIVGAKYLGWWIPSQAMFDPALMGSRIPWVSPFFQSLIAGTSEECLFRAMPLACAVLLGRKFGRRWLWIGGALLLQAMIFGSAHSSYPAMPGWVRLAELLIPSIVFGLLFLRFGLLPGMLMHGLYDILCMGLPLFTARTPGSSLNVAILVLLAVAPLGWVVFCRMRVGVWEDLPNDFRNAAWTRRRGKDPIPDGGDVEPPLLLRQLDSRNLLRIFFVGLAALAIWAFSMRVKPDVPGLSIRKAEAVVEARELLSKQGLPPGPGWEALPYAQADSDDERTFVWQTARERIFKQILGTYLSVPGWRVRFVRDQIPLPDRAEEYRVFLTGDGKVQRFEHLLPETREVPSLDQQGALTIAERELKRIYGLDSSALKLVSANQTRQLKRTDWSFVWQDPLIALGSGEARVWINLAGNSLSGYGRNVFVPEDWTREHTASANARNIATAILNVVLLIGVVWFLRGTFMGWRKHPFAMSAAIPIGVVTMFLFTVQLFVKLPEKVAWMSTGEPFRVQTLRLVALGTFALLPLSVFVGILAGIGSNRTKPAAPTRARAEFLAGIGVGFIVLLGERLVQLINPHNDPWYAGFQGANTGIPFLSGLWLTMPLILSSLLWLSVQRSLAASLRAGFVRISIVVALGIAIGATDNSSSWLKMTLDGVVLAAAFVFLDRLADSSHPSVIIAMVTARFLGRAGANLLIPAQPDSIKDSLVAILIVSLVGWLLFKTMRPVVRTGPAGANLAADPVAAYVEKTPDNLPV